MKKKQQDELLNSNYDGIQEYDNDLPQWWKVLFYITIVFGLGYAIYAAQRPTTDARLAAELKVIQDKKPVDILPTTSSESLLALAQDEQHLNSGKNIYITKCAACHGGAGEGLIGPNLTDEFWIHGGNISELRKTIEVGVLDKGMLAWKGVLTDAEINDVVAYVYSLRGTTPPNPKAPQGEKFEDGDA
jgi:cytochrome c oxidase cbb3-type subunit 3